MNIKELNDKPFSIVVWNLAKENDVHVYLGNLIIEQGEYFFKNELNGWKVSIKEDQLNDIKKVSEELKSTLLNAEYFINLTIKDLVDNQGEYIPTGMKWNE